MILTITFSSVQFSHSVVSDSLQLHGLQHIRLSCPSPAPWACSNSCPLGSRLPSNQSHPLSSPSPPAFNHFQHQGLFQWVRWPKYWSFSFSISPSTEYLGIISFRIDWFDLAVQGALKCLLQHHSSKTSVLWCSAFFIVQLLHSYMTWKNHTFDYMDLCWQSNVSACNMLSMFVIAFLPRSKCLLTWWLQSPSEVILFYIHKCKSS